MYLRSIISGFVLFSFLFIIPLSPVFSQETVSPVSVERKKEFITKRKALVEILKKRIRIMEVSEMALTDSEFKDINSQQIILKDREDSAIKRPAMFYLLKPIPELSGNDICDFIPMIDKEAHTTLCLCFTPRGTEKLGEVTEKLIGSKLAFILDETVLAAPFIQGKSDIDRVFLTSPDLEDLFPELFRY